MIKYYYISLIIITLLFAGLTIITGSQYVANGKRIADLEKQKKIAIEQSHTLEMAAAQQLSVQEISHFAQSEGYAPITQLAATSVRTEHVALRQ